MSIRESVSNRRVCHIHALIIDVPKRCPLSFILKPYHVNLIWMLLEYLEFRLVINDQVTLPQYVRLALHRVKVRFLIINLNKGNFNNRHSTIDHPNDVHTITRIKHFVLHMLFISKKIFVFDPFELYYDYIIHFKEELKARGGKFFDVK